MSYRRSREIRINILYIPIGVKSIAQILGLFADQKYSDSVSRIWFIHEERQNVTNSKLDWAVVFTARYARRKGETVDLGARLRKPSKAVADLLDNHEGDISGNGSRSIRLRGLGAVLTGANRQRRSRTCWPTLESHGNRSWHEYCDIFTDAVS